MENMPEEMNRLQIIDDSRKDDILMVKSKIFDAARKGTLQELRRCMEHRPVEDIRHLVSMRSEGITPLVVACRFGHKEIAEYLIVNCTADIEQTSCVTFDSETIRDVPPLWCAAAAGHLHVVSLLVGHGANVNATTRTNSTPLRAACFDGYLEIVKYLIKHGANPEIANRHGHTCLMIACYKGHFEIVQYLISLKVNVNRKSARGNTALHDSAESGSLNILQLLLENHAEMDVDCYGMTPILSAAVNGRKNVVEYMASHCQQVPVEEQIEALELLGATYLDKRRYLYLEAAGEAWKKALELRLQHNIPKETAELPFEGREVNNFEDLASCRSDPDAMRMQAMLVRLRILGPTHPDTAYFIRHRGVMFANSGDIDRCIELWTYALDMQQAADEPLSLMTETYLISFAELFTCILNKEIRSSPITVPCLLNIIDRGIKELQTGHAHILSGESDLERDCILLHRILVITLHLHCLLARFDPEQRSKDLRRSLYRLIQLNITGQNGMTPLHLSVWSETTLPNLPGFYIMSFPSVDLTSHLLEVGADPMATDDDGNTPLHIAATSHPRLPVLFRTLLNAGAHFDQRNKRGQTFLDLLKDNSFMTSYWGPICGKYMTLKCLSATVVKFFGLHVGDELVPREVREFIELH